MLGGIFSLLHGLYCCYIVGTTIFCVRNRGNQKPMDPVEEIRSRLDITEVVRDYITLKRTGKGFKGLCPFHKEKTPSFIVSPDKQLAYCFGCNKGGDIFTFIQLIEKVEFPQALEILAKRAGVALPERSPGLQDRKTRLFDMHKIAAEHFEQQLFKAEEGKPALEYLKKRGIKLETIKEFRLGYAPDTSKKLINLLVKSGYRMPEIEDAGLAIKGKTGHYDRFRGRLMFPLTNPSGMVVGFTGRASSQTKGPKYLNSPETAIYDKGSILYGLHKAKNHIRESEDAVIVEGNMDVLAVWQAGTKNVVASSGTALTSNQLGLISRYTKQLLFSFDADGAGQQAAMRGIELAAQQGIAVRVVKLLVGKDPDQCIRQDPKLWGKSLKQAKDYMDYCQDHVFTQYDIGTARGKSMASKEMLRHIGKLSSSVEQDYYIKRLAKDLNVDAAALREDIEKTRQAMSAKRGVARSTGSGGRVGSGKFREQDQEEQIKKPGYTKEHFLMGLLLSEPRLVPVFAQEKSKKALFTANFWDLWEKMDQARPACKTHKKDARPGQARLDIKKFWKSIPAEQARKLQILGFMVEQRYQNMSFEDKKQEVRLLIAKTAAEKQKGKIVKLAELLKQAENQENEKEGERIAAEMNKILHTKE